MSFTSDAVVGGHQGSSWASDPLSVGAPELLSCHLSKIRSTFACMSQKIGSCEAVGGALTVPLHQLCTPLCACVSSADVNDVYNELSEIESIVDCVGSDPPGPGGGLRTTPGGCQTQSGLEWSFA